MEKIKELTPDQERALISYRDEWLQVGRSTERADRAKCEQAFAEMYAHLGKPAPVVMWFDGPATGAIARTILAKAKARPIKENLGENLAANIWENLADDLRANIWENLADDLRDNLAGNTRWSGWGRHEGYWVAYYGFVHHYVRQIHTPEQMARLGLCETLARHCGWWEPYEGVVIACEPPSDYRLDHTGRMHCTDGPALTCRDGWTVYAVGGVRVPAWIIEQRDTITPDKIKAETNAEVRRVMVRLYGLDRYLSDVGALRIDERPADCDIVGLRTGALYRVEDDAGEWHFIDVLNSTPEPDGSVKRYQIVVNGGAYNGDAGRTLHAAWASTFRRKSDPAQMLFPKWQDCRFEVET